LFFVHFFCTFGFAEGTSVRKNKSKKLFFIWFFAHLFVPLDSPKVLEKSSKKVLLESFSCFFLGSMEKKYVPSQSNCEEKS